jgi:hypothetical protein
MIEPLDYDPEPKRDSRAMMTITPDYFSVNKYTANDASQCSPA